MSTMSKEELLALVKNICNADFNSEEEYEKALTILEKNVKDPYVSDLLFHHKPSLTPEEIVNKALSYKPIILPPPDNGKDMDK